MGKKSNVVTPDYGDLRPELEAALKIIAKKNITGGFLHVYLDNLATILSSHGGVRTEEVLTGMIKEVTKILKAEDKITRRNKDTIKILLVDYSPEKIEEAALKIYQLISDYGCLSSLEPVQISAVIGGVDFPVSSDNAEDIINKAYVAMSDALKEGAHYRHYINEAKHVKESRNQMIMAAYFRNAFVEKKLRLAFQPIIECKTGEIAYYESLLRIINDDGSASSAGPFIPIAEKMGFIDSIDMAVLDMVIVELKRTPELKLSVNVSNASIASSRWLEKASMVLGDSSIASRIIVEIIETAEQTNVAKTVEFISELQKFGCQIALDDFGTGYTSFSQLKSLPVNIIKIDGSFVRDITNNEKNRFFVKTLLEFSKNFNLKTVAEFVEDGLTAEILNQMGVDYLQGNYFSPAVTYRGWMDAEAEI